MNMTQKTKKTKETEKKEKDEVIIPDDHQAESSISPETDESSILSELSDETRDQLAEVNDKYLRLYSEFDNYRKRTLKEKIELGKTATSEVIKDILPVIDDLERAIASFGEPEGPCHPMKEGIILIYNKFFNILAQKGLEQMKTIGEMFDTDRHEAVTKIPAPSPEMKGKVVDEIEKGYLLNGKVLRYAKVVIGS
jgi:molecular chaperone GrpE